VDRSDFTDAHAHFVHPENAALPAGNGFVADFNVGWKKEVTFGPPAGLEDFNWHNVPRTERRKGAEPPKNCKPP
jgi:hypothetical protein